jgi:hypothetical protein
MSGSSIHIGPFTFLVRRGANKTQTIRPLSVIRSDSVLSTRCTLLPTMLAVHSVRERTFGPVIVHCCVSQVYVLTYEIGGC